LTVVEPLFDITNTATNERTWPLTNNIQMEKYEFPVVGDIVIEQAE
jgi:hypothetical protein